MKKEEEFNKGEIVIYKSKKDRKLKGETSRRHHLAYTSRTQIAELFGTQRPSITKHLNNIFKSGELEEKVVCSIFGTYHST